MAMTPENPSASRKSKQQENVRMYNPSLLDEHGGISDEWVAWHRSLRDCSTVAAVLEGVRQHRQLLEKMKKFQQVVHEAQNPPLSIEGFQPGRPVPHGDGINLGPHTHPLFV